MQFYTYKLFSLIAALWAIIASPVFASTPQMSAKFSARILSRGFSNFCEFNCVPFSKNLAGEIVNMEVKLYQGPFPVDPVILSEAKLLGPLPFSEDDARLSADITVGPPTWVPSPQEIEAFGLINPYSVVNYDYIECPLCFVDYSFFINADVSPDSVSLSTYTSRPINQNITRSLNMMLAIGPGGNIVGGGGQTYYNYGYPPYPSMSFNFEILEGSVTFDQSGAVPEPASWMLLISGFFLSGGMLRRKNELRKARIPNYV